MQTVISPINTEERSNLGIKAGDTVRVWQKIQERGKTRLQAFEGLVLARKHGNEPGATFTVRRVSSGVGIEKVFPLYSPMIDRIEIVRRAKVRRAKLYYIRDKVAREIKRQMRNMRLVNISTESDIGAKEALRQAQDEAAAKAAEKAETADGEAKEASEPEKKEETSTEESEEPSSPEEEEKKEDK